MTEVLKGTGVRLLLVEETPGFGPPAVPPITTINERADYAAYRDGEVIFVGWQAFADLEDDGRRFEFGPRFGAELPIHLDRDPTAELVEAAFYARKEEFGQLLGDLRIGEMGMTRWEFHAAPFRIALSDKLRERLAVAWRGSGPKSLP